MRRSQRMLLVPVVCAVAATAVVGAVVFDGMIDFDPGGEWEGRFGALQDNYTQFGNQILGGYSGSEIDELYVQTDGTFLYVGVTGNLEENGNSQIILLDVRPGGQQILATEIAPIVAELPCSGNGPPYAVQNLGQALTNDAGTPPQTIRDAATTGTILDPGFEPDYAIAVDTFGHVVHVTQYDLYAVSQGTWDDPGTNDGTPCGPPNEALAYFATRTYRGQTDVDSGTGVLVNGNNPNGSEFAYNNTGYNGVTGNTVAAPGSSLPGDPRTQTTGLEAKIALADLGIAVPLTGELTIRIAVVLTSGGGRVSSQTLPGIGGPNPPADIGLRPDFAAIPGNQFASVTRVPTLDAPVIDGLNIPAEFGVSDLVASQDTPTSFGDHPQNPDLNTAGSELDQLFAGSDRSLEIAITGNLEPNGNNLVIFLDTLPEQGEGLTNALDANAGRISGLATDKIPLDADYALVINNWQGTIYVDLIDLINNTSTYIGANGTNTGEGILENGGPVVGWEVALNNTNVVGVDDDGFNDPIIQQANAATATTGFEIKIPLSAIGAPADASTVCLFAVITGGGYLSNQFLPAGVGGGWSNFGNPPVDLTAYGYSCLPVVIHNPPPCNAPPQDTDGDGDVDLGDFGQFSACFNGPNRAWSGPPADQNVCRCVDADGDLDVDLTDFSTFSGCFNGPNRPPVCG